LTDNVIVLAFVIKAISFMLRQMASATRNGNTAKVEDPIASKDENSLDNERKDDDVVGQPDLGVAGANDLMTQTLLQDGTEFAQTSGTKETLMYSVPKEMKALLAEGPVIERSLSMEKTFGGGYEIGTQGTNKRSRNALRTPSNTDVTPFESKRRAVFNPAPTADSLYSDLLTSTDATQSENFATKTGNVIPSGNATLGAALQHVLPCTLLIQDNAVLSAQDTIAETAKDDFAAKSGEDSATDPQCVSPGKELVSIADNEPMVGIEMSGVVGQPTSITFEPAAIAGDVPAPANEVTPIEVEKVAAASEPTFMGVDETVAVVEEASISVAAAVSIVEDQALEKGVNATPEESAVRDDEILKCSQDAEPTNPPEAEGHTDENKEAAVIADSSDHDSVSLSSSSSRSSSMSLSTSSESEDEYLSSDPKKNAKQLEYARSRLRCRGEVIPEEEKIPNSSSKNDGKQESMSLPRKSRHHVGESSFDEEAQRRGCSGEASMRLEGELLVDKDHIDCAYNYDSSDDPKGSHESEKDQASTGSLKKSEELQRRDTRGPSENVMRNQRGRFADNRQGNNSKRDSQGRRSMARGSQDRDERRENRGYHDNRDLGYREDRSRGNRDRHSLDRGNRGYDDYDRRQSGRGHDKRMR